MSNNFNSMKKSIENVLLFLGIGFIALSLFIFFYSFGLYEMLTDIVPSTVNGIVYLLLGITFTYLGRSLRKT